MLRCRWPLVKGRKLEYMAWFQTGPGSWPHLRPKMLQLLEAMQQQGLYDADATSPPAAAAADAAGAADADEASSSSSNEDQQEQQQQQPAVTGRPLGLMGVGWGNFILFQAAGDDAVVQAGAKALAAISPATYNKDYDMSLKLQLPVALLPAKYDTMDQMMLFINMFAKPWELRCIFKRFGKVGMFAVLVVLKTMVVLFMGDQGVGVSHFLATTKALLCCAGDQHAGGDWPSAGTSCWAAKHEASECKLARESDFLKQ
jgi:hypothetical protein